MTQFKKFAFYIFLFLVPGFLLAQDSLILPRNFKDAYEMNHTRDINGTPGINYWQNKAVYKINVHYDPVTRLVSGTETIIYTNNSPDTLKNTLFKLYPNLYEKGSIRDMPIDPQDLSDGVSIKEIMLNSVLLKNKSWRINGTNMTLRKTNLLPHSTNTFQLSFSYILNKNSHIRTGEVDEGSAFIAYFFPRIAVYDDIDGWNQNPYVGSQEFYNDFCNFSVDITVPKNFIVWATGTLSNCNQVLKEKYCKRLNKAETSDQIDYIIDSADLLNKNEITKNNDFNTWHFDAEHVTDFVFATSDHYLWKSTSLIVDSLTGRRTRVDVAFNPAHKDFYEVMDFAKKTVEYMSFRFPKWPYPYPHETVFDGLDQMEYPMMVNDNPLEDREQTIELTDHEIFHTMFPFYMGINETKYGWMDEGWATIGEWVLTSMIDSNYNDNYGIDEYEYFAGDEGDVPIMTLTTMLAGQASYLNTYPKPGFGYLYVKDMLGDSLFYKGLHYYITQWNGKHPLPYDFFNCMNTGSGVNLNWFWKNWYFDDGIPDLAIENVLENAGQFTITIAKHGSKAVPIDLNLFFQDGSTQKIHRNIAVWKNATSIDFVVNSKKQLKKITLGDMYDVDSNKSDNIWKADKL
ncbi:MAG: M1 family metallopeptidase [Bacteroidetes bacterium]|nr:M1 family metallopeptidase [Bacteroidota bacterium]